jgi:hypothetical protein
MFIYLLDSIGAFLEGAAKDETFVWLDIFAINQDVRPLIVRQMPPWSLPTHLSLMYVVAVRMI